MSRLIIAPTSKGCEMELNENHFQNRGGAALLLYLQKESRRQRRDSLGEEGAEWEGSHTEGRQMARPVGNKSWIRQGL